MIAPGYELHAKQQLALTPRLQQSVKLLQLSALEFTREIEQAIANNPFLEEIDTHAADRDAVADGTTSELNETVDADVVLATSNELASAVDDANSFGNDGDDPQTDEFSSVDFGNREYGAPGSNGGDNDESDPANWNHALPSLREHLHTELGLYPLSQRDRALCEMVIEALDDDGYLRQDLQELATQIFPPPVPVAQELSTALTRVQQLDAPGIGARSVVECLSLQLLAIPSECADRELALRIVNEQMTLLARHDRNALQRALGCDAAALQRACALIHKLDPRPGLRFGRGEQGYVVPDVMVRKVRGQWVVHINQAVLPKARLNRMYADMFHQSRCGSRSPLAQKLQEARWLIRNAEQRFSTIQRVAEAIVAHQRHFFEYGDVALRPLVLRDLAEELELHESTISRATGNKFMDTPRGLYEFKHFFSRQLATESGGTCSSASVRALLKELIDGEDVDTPFSDVDLTRLLAEQGVIVARRTVAKYRRLMRVPPAELRRRVS